MLDVYTLLHVSFVSESAPPLPRSLGRARGKHTHTYIYIYICMYTILFA